MRITPHFFSLLAIIKSIENSWLRDYVIKGLIDEPIKNDMLASSPMGSLLRL